MTRQSWGRCPYSRPPATPSCPFGSREGLTSRRCAMKQVEGRPWSNCESRRTPRQPQLEPKISPIGPNSGHWRAAGSRRRNSPLLCVEPDTFDLHYLDLGCCRCTAPYTKHGSHGGKMRGSRTTLGILLVASITCGSVQAAPRQPACIEIMASCEQAGFVRGDAKAGDGLFIDCVIPIVRGTPQRPRASKPLPQIDPKLVADRSEEH